MARGGTLILNNQKLTGRPQTPFLLDGGVAINLDGQVAFGGKIKGDSTPNVVVVGLAP